MTRDELRAELEPLARPMILERASATEACALLVRRWLDQSGLDVDAAFAAFNDTMVDIVADLSKPKPQVRAELLSVHFSAEQEMMP